MLQISNNEANERDLKFESYKFNLQDYYKFYEGKCILKCERYVFLIKGESNRKRWLVKHIKERSNFVDSIVSIRSSKIINLKLK